jgi:hypothetical protein
MNKIDNDVFIINQNLQKQIAELEVKLEKANILLFEVIETDQKGNKLNSDKYIEDKINKYFQ